LADFFLYAGAVIFLIGSARTIFRIFTVRQESLVKALMEEDYPLYLKMGAPAGWSPGEFGKGNARAELKKFVLGKAWRNHPSQRVRNAAEYELQQAKSGTYWFMSMLACFLIYMFIQDLQH